MSVGYGSFDVSCPKNASGHEWRSVQRGDLRPCIHCRAQGRGKGGFMDKATAARSAFFATLQSPLSSNGKAMKR